MPAGTMYRGEWRAGACIRVSGGAKRDVWPVTRPLIPAENMKTACRLSRTKGRSRLSSTRALLRRTCSPNGYTLVMTEAFQAAVRYALIVQAGSDYRWPKIRSRLLS